MDSKKYKTYARWQYYNSGFFNHTTFKQFGPRVPASSINEKFSPEKRSESVSYVYRVGRYCIFLCLKLAIVIYKSYKNFNMFLRPETVPELALFGPTGAGAET